MIPFFNARASDGSTGCGWAGNARRLSYRDLNEKKVRGRVFRHVCLANDSIAFMCAGCISMVPAVAAAVRTVNHNVADHRLDSKHYSYFLCLAFARSGTAVVSSRLDAAAGIRFRGNNCCRYRVAPEQTIGRNAKLGGPGRVKRSAPQAIFRTCANGISRIRVSRNHDGGAGTAELRQIAVCGHTDVEAWSLPPNNRTIKVRLL